MTEEAFRLTPVDVRTQEFGRAAFGYNTASVDEFRERVAEEMERLLKERISLEDRLQNFREQLKALREREKAINDAVMLAQQLQEGAQKTAQQEAELIVREARARADEIVKEAQVQEQNLRRDLVEAQSQFSAYLAAFRRLLDRQMAQLDVLEAFERDGSPPGTP